MKKVLSQAIAAATIFGAASAAQAVQVSHGGDGQALMFPYYSVENGNYTALHLTNTTDEFKAVKVRFRRSTDSADSLDFNLYLSPKDMWTGAVLPGAGGIPKLVTYDTSCISGQTEASQQAGIPFHPVVGQKAQKGHIEIIEMASWDRELAEKAIVNNGVTVEQAIEHVAADANGVRRPGNCAAVTASWVAGQGHWATVYEADAEGNTDGVFRETDLGTVPTGGLYGNAYVVNPDEAWASSFAPVVLSELYTGENNNHHAPRYALPDLQGVSGKTGSLIDIQTLVIGLNASGPQKDELEKLINLQNHGMVGFAEIETALAKASVMSDFTVGGASEATTELVVTFPVKYAGSPDGKVEIETTFYDREEDTFVLVPEDYQTSPWLPGVNPENPTLDDEVNVVSLGENARQDIGGKTISLNIPVDSGEGWVDIEFKNQPTGVPVIGFTSTVLKNGTILGNGGINSYALNFPLKYTAVD